MSAPAPDTGGRGAPAGIHVAPGGGDLRKMALGALGVVYGDLGTSPLYALRECFRGEHPVSVTAPHVYGVLSLVFWVLILVIVIKYLTFIMQADNRGEGGILALCALVLSPGDGGRRRRIGLIVLAGLFGAGLLYGDGVITPAISILGAVEGLTVAAPRLVVLVVPITAGILLALFMVQRHGTGRIGAVFGWVVLIWFIAIGTAGAIAIAGRPGILRALNPIYAIRFFVEDGGRAFWLLGAVVLVVTGVTARYGFMQTPNVPRLLAGCAATGLVCEPDRTSYYLGRETLLIGKHARMAPWRKTLFSFLARNSRPATAFFQLPPNRVIELGAQIEL